MIPKLYESNGEVLIGSLHNSIKGIVIEERNGMFEAELIYPFFGQYIDKLIRGNIIKADANDKLKNQKFRIYRISKPISGKVTILARHISYDLLRDFIENIEIENQSCEYALNSIFRASQFSKHFVGVSDIINAQNFSISDMDALKAIAGTKGSILDTYGTGAELLRDNTTIKVLNKRGHDNGVTIEYKKNLTGFNYTLDETGLITRIRAFAKYNVEGEEITVYSNPKFIDSPKINDYETPFIQAIDFSSHFEEGNTPTPEKLKLLAEKYFIENKCDIPKMNYKIEFVPLSKCVGYEGLEDKIELCDLVTIKNSMYNITTLSKVIKYKYDFLKEKYESMELGEAKTTLGNVVGDKEPGKPGPPGANGNLEDFPDTLPQVPELTAKVLGFASVELKWTYENKLYYNYEVYASKTENFEPNVFNLIFSGQASSFLHQVKPSEIWYYKARAVNSHSKFTDFSTQVKVITKKIDDMENYFDKAAIGNAVVGVLNADYMEAGIIKGHWIDAKNLSVTDGNGKRTLDIDSYGNVYLDVNNLKIKGNNAADTRWVESELKLYNDSISANVEKVVNSGISNLVPFSYFKDHSTIKKHWFLNGVTWFEDGDRIGIQNKYNANGNIISEGKAISNRTVSLYSDLSVESNITAKIHLVGSRTDKLQYDWALDAISYTKNESGGKKIEGITIPSYVKTLFIQVSNLGEGTTTHNVVWIDKINLVDGYIAKSGDLFDIEQASQLSIDAQGIRTEVEKKVDNDKIISSINQSAESVKILAKFLELTGYATFKDLASPGATTIDGRNIKTGFIEAIQLIAPHITGKSRMYLEQGSVFSSDGETNVKNFYGMPGGTFDVESEATFGSVVNATRFRTNGNYVPFSRTGYKWVIESLQGIGTDSGDAIELQMVGGNKFGVDLWWIGNSLIEPYSSGGKRGLDIIANLRHTENYKTLYRKNDLRLIYDEDSIPNEFTYVLKQDNGSYVRQVSPRLIFPHITLAIQQQQEQINTLNMEVDKLKEQINLLLNKLN